MSVSVLATILLASSVPQAPIQRDPRSEFERQAEEADFIVLGRAQSFEIVEIEGVGKARAAIVNVEYSVDSRITNKQISIVISAPISHMEVDCCIIGQRYIFLVYEHQNLYYPVRGGQGAHLIPKTAD